MVKKPTSKSSGSGTVASLTSEFCSVVSQVTDNYKKTASTRTALIDGFLAFLLALGVLQFVFCILVGTFPFNGFLGGFAATVGQFVLTAALRIQTNRANLSQFPQVSPERALGDFIFGSLLLHFTVYHFIN